MYGELLGTMSTTAADADVANVNPTPFTFKKFLETKFGDIDFSRIFAPEVLNTSDIPTMVRHWNKFRKDGDLICGLSNNTSSHVVVAVKFWASGVAICAVAGAGLIGNLLSFVTIVTMKKRNLFNNLLLTLTIFDTLFLLCGGVFFASRAFKFKNALFSWLCPYLIYPVAGISMTGSTYTCCAIALERFLGICYAQSDFVIRRSRYYICCILLISIIIDCPRFFEIRDADEEFKYTALRTNPYYIQYYTHWFRLISTAVVPFVLMLCFNLKILYYYKKNSFAFGGSITASGGANQPMVTTKSLDQPVAALASASQAAAEVGPVKAPVGPQAQGQTAQQTASINAQQNQERTLYLTFFCLTVTFFLGHLPRIVLNLKEFTDGYNKELCSKQYLRPYYSPEWVLILHSIEKTALICNSSINFGIYCMVGKTFRQHMCRSLFGSCGRCMRVVTGVDPTTTGGTGETTVPDLEASRTLGGHSVRLHQSGRIRHSSCDFVSFDEIGDLQGLQSDLKKTIHEEEDEDQDRSTASPTGHAAGGAKGGTGAGLIEVKITETRVKTTVVHTEVAMVHSAMPESSTTTPATDEDEGESSGSRNERDYDSSSCSLCGEEEIKLQPEAFRGRSDEERATNVSSGEEAAKSALSLYDITIKIKTSSMKNATRSAPSSTRKYKRGKKKMSTISFLTPSHSMTSMETKKRSPVFV